MMLKQKHTHQICYTVSPFNQHRAVIVNFSLQHRLTRDINNPIILRRADIFFALPLQSIFSLLGMLCAHFPDQLTVRGERLTMFICGSRV